MSIVRLQNKSRELYTDSGIPNKYLVTNIYIILNNNYLTKTKYFSKQKQVV